MKMRVIQDYQTGPPPTRIAPRRRLNKSGRPLASRMARWSAGHRKRAVFGLGRSDRVDATAPNCSERRNMMTSPAPYPKAETCPQEACSLGRDDPRWSHGGFATSHLRNRHSPEHQRHSARRNFRKTSTHSSPPGFPAPSW